MKLQRKTLRSRSFKLLLWSVEKHFVHYEKVAGQIRWAAAVYVINGETLRKWITDNEDKMVKQVSR